MTAVSPSLASFEKDAAVDVAKRLGARHELVASSEIEIPTTFAITPTAASTASQSSID